MKGYNGGGTSREKWVRLFFDTHAGYVGRGLQLHRVSQEEALDAYTDAVLVVVDHIISGKFRGESKVSTYLFRIFSNKIVDRVRHHSTEKSESQYHWTDELPMLPERARSALGALIVEEEISVIKYLIERLGEKCRKLIWDSEYWGYDLHEIAEELGLGSARSASTQKYRCMEKLREVIRKRNIY